MNRLLVFALALGSTACGIDDVGDRPIAAPFAVSDYFAPSGFMGDASARDRDPEPLVMTRGEGCAPRPPGARGICYRVDYHPFPRVEGGVGWAGVYFQSPANNWGQDPPQRVTPNATRVSLYAAGRYGGENVLFLVGGLSATDPDGAPLPYADTLSLEQAETLTTSMTRYEIRIPAEATYDQVIGGFGFSVSSAEGTSASFFLDDVVWLP